MKPKNNTRNFILVTFLKNYKRIEPHCFRTNEEYYNQFEPAIKKVLDSPSNFVVILTEGGATSIYKAPFNEQIEQPVIGWVIAGKVQDQPTIFSIFVSKDSRFKGYGKAVVETAFEELNNPKTLNLFYPTKSIFNFLRNVLQKRTRVFC